MSLTPEQRDELRAALRRARVDDGAPVRLFSEGDIVHLLWLIAPVLAQMLAAEREAGAAEVRARVEAVLEATRNEPERDRESGDWKRGARHVRVLIRRALTTEDPS